MEGSRFKLDDIHGYGSEFSDCNSEAEVSQKQKNEDALYKKPNMGTLGLLHSGISMRKPSKRVAQDLLDVEEGKRMRYHGLLAMDAYTRHKKLVNDYLCIYGGKVADFKRDSFERELFLLHHQKMIDKKEILLKTIIQTPIKTKSYKKCRILSDTLTKLNNEVSSRDRTDHDVIKENHRFLWDDDDDDEDTTWGRRLAKKYWDKLYKEYAICDLSRYKENKIAFRWRIEKEVISGKGQFECGNKRCTEKDGLRSWEVNFAYTEDSEKKNALVKCRLCSECSYKLNYFHKKKDVTKYPTTHNKNKRKMKHKHRKKRISDSSGGESPCSSSAKKLENSADDEEHQVWSQPAQIENEKSREEEFDDYFEGLFL